MLLRIERDQAPRMFGGVKFVLRVQVQLTSEEHALVEKYGVRHELLFQKEIKTLLTGKIVPLDITIDSLLKGTTHKCASIADVIKYEICVKEGCSTFGKYLELMRTFGGSETIEYSAGEVIESEEEPLLDDEVVSTCGDCGTVNLNGAEFCRACGVPLVWDDTSNP
ncbi:MAG: zinc ribbon domain-containing protein [Candidatus Zixiibacteriota bacterium]